MVKGWLCGEGEIKTLDKAEVGWGLKWVLTEVYPRGLWDAGGKSFLARGILTSRDGMDVGPGHGVLGRNQKSLV